MCFFLVRLATTVVFVPSHRDVHHDFVYPQPPFSTKVNTAEFNAAEVKLCLAYSLEYHKMPLLFFPESYVQTFLTTNAEKHTIINGITGDHCSAVSINDKLPLHDNSLKSSKTCPGSDKLAKEQSLTLNSYELQNPASIVVEFRHTIYPAHALLN